MNFKQKKQVWPVAGEIPTVGQKTVGVSAIGSRGTIHTIGVNGHAVVVAVTGEMVSGHAVVKYDIRPGDGGRNEASGWKFPGQRE